MIKQCEAPDCGNTFIFYVRSRNGPNTGRYCSRVCRGLMRRKLYPCRACGCDTRSPNRYYCSSKCRPIPKGPSLPRGIITLLCDWCDRDFTRQATGGRGPQRFCSVRCRKRAHKGNEVAKARSNRVRADRLEAATVDNVNPKKSIQARPMALLALPSQGAKGIASRLRPLGYH